MTPIDVQNRRRLTARPVTSRGASSSKQSVEAKLAVKSRSGSLLANDCVYVPFGSACFSAVPELARAFSLPLPECPRKAFLVAEAGKLRDLLYRPARPRKRSHRQLHPGHFLQLPKGGSFFL